LLSIAHESFFKNVDHAVAVKVAVLQMGVFPMANFKLAARLGRFDVNTSIVTDR
jgi:hypothetical protein